jgi:methyl-accepting chemotaxis protein
MNELLELKRKILLLESKKDKLKYYEEDYIKLKEKEGFQKEAWIKEQRDVEKLEKGSSVSFFLKLFGKLEEKIAKEELEALDAKHKYESTQYELNNVKVSILNLKDEIKDYDKLVKEYEALWKQKERELLNSSSFKKQEYVNSTEKLASLKVLDKELKEAVNAGDSLIEVLEEAKKEFESAKSWGTLDMFGGGVMSSMIKRGHIENANRVLNEVQYLVKSFKKELNDVNVSLDMKYVSGDFSDMTDIFFDNFFSDIMVQDKINNALNNVNRTLRVVERNTKELRKSIEVNNTEMDLLNDRIKGIVEDFKGDI